MSSEAKISITVDGAKVAQDAFRGVEKAVDGTTKNVASAGAQFRQLNSYLTTFGVGLSVGAVISFGRELLADADALAKMADKTGIATDNLQRMQIAGDDAGVSLESMTSAVNMLQKRLGAGDEGAAKALADMNINIETFKNLDGAQMMALLSDRVREMHDPLRVADDLSKLFGRSWAEMLPALKRGFDEVQEGIGGMGAGTVDWLDKAGDAIDKFYRTAKASLGDRIVSLATGMSAEVRNLAFEVQRATEAAGKMAPKIATVAPHEVELNIRSIERALDDERKKLDAGTKAAAEKRKETKKYTESVRELESGMAGLHATVGILDDSEQTMLEHLLAGRREIDQIERSAWRASFGLKGMADGLEEVGTHNDDIVILNRALQRMVEIEKTLPAGFHQAGLELDSLGMKSTELEELNARLGNLDDTSKSWDDTLDRLTQNFVEMADIGGDEFGAVARQIGMSVSAVKQLSESMRMLQSTGAGGGWNAANLASMAAGWVGVATAIYSVWRAMEDADKAADAAARLRTQADNLTRQFHTTSNFSKQLASTLADLRDELNLVFPPTDRGGFFTNTQRAQALQMLDIIRELGGAAQLTRGQLEEVLQSVPRLLEMIAQGGPLAAQALETLLGLYGEFVPSLDDITEAAARYGLKLDELGPKVQQMRLDEVANQIARDFEILIGAGVPFETLMKNIIRRTTETGDSFDEMSQEAQDAYLKAGGKVTSVTTGMHKQIQDVVKDALRLGLSLPEAMRPILEKLIESGDLVDENGDKLEDLSRFNFAKPLEQMIESLIQKLEELISKMVDVGDAAANIGVPREGAVPRNPRTPAAPSRPDPTGPGGGGGGGSPSQGRSSGSSSSNLTITVPVNLDGREITRAVVPLVPAELRRLGAI